MGSAETVKASYGYLWWIMVASAWLERRRDEGTIQRNKKSQQPEIKQSEANWALFWTCISREKNHENKLISTTGEGTHRRQKEGKMLAGLCRDCENVSRMKNALKTWPNAFHFATRNELKVKKKYKIRSSLNRTKFHTSLGNPRHQNAAVSLSHTSIQQFSYRTFARTETCYVAQFDQEDKENMAAEMGSNL